MTTRDSDIEAFGGTVGRILRDAMSVGTLVTGLTLMVTLGSLGFIMNRFGASDAFNIFILIATTGAMARFALNGFAGEWGGTLFSTRGGSWYEVGAVSARYLALSATWIIPVLLLGWKPELVGEAVGSLMMGGGGTKVISLTTLVVALLALTPPVFLIVAVSAARFGDLVDRDHWEHLFDGRKSDLYLIYVIYLGALSMVMVLLLPVITAIGLQNDDLGTVLGLLVLAFATGLAVTLLGRLCGFFAGSLLDQPEEFVESPLTPEVAPGKISPNPPRPAGDPSALNPSGKTPLLDARERVDELERRYEEDSESAVGGLRELNETYAPHPLVLHQLCLQLAKSSMQKESLEIAGEALPLCLERGAIRLASDIFALHLESADGFKLPRDTLLALGDDLRRSRDLASAEETYAGILAQDRSERRAVKGLLQLAETHLEESNYVHARGLFQDLLEGCGDSPFADHMQRGLAEAERRMAKAS